MVDAAVFHAPWLAAMNDDQSDPQYFDVIADTAVSTTVPVQWSTKNVFRSAPG
jgi:hypothetical protein